MRAGRMRHRVTIQKRTLVPDGPYGETKEVWEDNATVWASLEPLKGSEYFNAQDVAQRVAAVESRMYIRHRPGLNPADNRIVHKGVTYDIVGILGDNWGKDMQLMVKAAAISQADGSTTNG